MFTIELLERTATINDELLTEEELKIYEDRKDLLPIEKFNGCSYQIGQEGVVVRRIGTKINGVNRTHILQISDAAIEYISKHLNLNKVFQCSSSYPVWSDGVKVAKMCYTTRSSTDYNDTLRITKELGETNIPHPKLYDSIVLNKRESIIISEYVGRSLDLNDSFDEWEDQVDKLVNKITKLGYRVDNHEGNFCVKDGKLYAIDFDKWKN